MEEESRDLGDVFQAGTAWIGLAFTVIIIGLSVLGLAMSLNSFIRMARHVRENGGEDVPWGHIMGVILAGLISVSGLIYGFASLLWSPA